MGNLPYIERLIERLKHSEGLRLYAYKDSLGIWTIGFGRMIDPEKGGKITEAEGRVVLYYELGGEDWAAVDREVARRQFTPHLYRGDDGLLRIGYETIIEQGSSLFTAEAAAALLKNDVAVAVDEAASMYWWHDLTPARKHVIVDMIFNLGLPRFKGFKRMIAAVIDDDYGLAEVEMLDSRWARQVGTRADELGEMMRVGDFLKT